MTLISNLKLFLTLSFFYLFSNTYAQEIPPFIKQLEGLNEGKEAKLTMTNGLANQEYLVQYRLQGAVNWVDANIKIKRTDNSAEALVLGLESKNKYCFRLQKKDSVTKKEIFSNEVCTINLTYQLLSSSEVKLDWNNPDSVNTQEFTILITDENGENPNNNAPTPRINTSLVLEYLDCSKKYKFKVTASLSEVANKVTIISPQILVDPKSLQLLPASKGFSLVSLQDNKQIRYNVFEASGFLKNKYEFYRSVNGENMTKIGEGASNSFTDVDIDAEKNQYCYAYLYKDACGTKSALSDKSCNIKLSFETPNKLIWTPFIIATNKDINTEKTEYFIEYLNNEDLLVGRFDIVDSTNYLLDYIFTIIDAPVKKFRILGSQSILIKFGSDIVPFRVALYSNIVTISPVLNNNSIAIYPNPSEEKILIYSPIYIVKSVEVIDMKGSLIHTSEIIDNQLNISAFIKGNYVLRLYDSSKKFIGTQKIVKL